MRTTLILAALVALIPLEAAAQWALPPNKPPAPKQERRAQPERGPGGSVRVGTGDYWFGTGPGYVYSCQRDVLRTWPKTGGREFSHGPCRGAFRYQGDGSGTYFCDSDGVKRIPEQGDPQMITGGAAKGCILDAIDDEFVYYIVPGFEGVKEPGLYRVAKIGGAPTKLLATKRGEQIVAVIDGDELWVSAWKAGTISRMPKAGGPLTTVVTGQKDIVNLQVDGDALYWYPETAGEIRKRKKSGGAITVVARGLTREPLRARAGHLFWVTGSRERGEMLMHLAPDSKKPEVLVRGLESPSLVVDDEGLYFQEFGKGGIYMLPLPASTSR